MQISATSVVGVICRNMLGPVGGAAAIIGVIVLPVTSGDTALRSLRLMLVDTFHLKQENAVTRVLFALPIFTVVYICLIVAKVNPAGFNIIWRYFGWSNQTLAVFALACIVIWMMWNGRGKYLWMPLIPLVFYAFITTSYILSTEVGLSLPIPVSFVGGAVFTVIITAAVLRKGKRAGR